MTSPTPEEALASVIRDAMKEAMNPTAQTFRLPAPSDSRSWETPMKAIGVTMEDVSAHIARAILASGYALPAESGEYGHLVANALARMNGRVDVMTFNERSEHGGGFSTHAEVRCVGDNEREQSQVAWCCDEEDARVIASIPAMARAIASLSAENAQLKAGRTDFAVNALVARHGLLKIADEDIADLRAHLAAAREAIDASAKRSAEAFDVMLSILRRGLAEAHADQSGKYHAGMDFVRDLQDEHAALFASLCASAQRSL